ncbi:c-type cytochrome [Roseateles cavernae]|uniref:c-type cytochrome n=1 Tax=Roseateles cavernae TaxID=3153578 RepID=UPI0032E484FB
MAASQSEAEMRIMAKLTRFLILALPLLVAGCAVELQNTEMVARERAQLAGPSGSVYTGWRIFQDKCAACHGSAATGGKGAPDLLQRVREIGPQRFVGLVLTRYDWNLPALPPAGAAREAALEALLQRQQGALTMPAWQGEPSVNVHIADLYAYLSARAAGTQGPGRPAP